MNLKRLVLFVAILVILASVVVSVKNTSHQNINPVPAVSPTPTVESQNPGWKTFKDNVLNVSFDYPQDLPTKFIHPQEWPPKISVSKDGFVCNESGLGINGLPGMTIRKTIGNIEYCIESVSEGAAGTIYTNYTYTFLKNNRLIKLEFSLGYPQCGNYDVPQKTECESERQTFDLDSLLNRIGQTVQL